LQSQATQSLQHSFIITSLAFTVEGSGDGGNITQNSKARTIRFIFGSGFRLCQRLKTFSQWGQELGRYAEHFSQHHPWELTSCSYPTQDKFLHAMRTIWTP
jgi:hypothetical protein